MDLENEPEAQNEEALPPAERARQHYSRMPALQVVAEILRKLRTSDFHFWTPEVTLERWPVLERFRWLAQRPDLRQSITTTMTGLPAATAQKKPPEFQAQLVQSVMDAGDRTKREVEEAFDVRDLAIYGNTAEFWAYFCEKFPWEEASPKNKAFIGWAIRTLVTERNAIDDAFRRPILTPLDVRSAIATKVWQHHLPLEIRSAIDDARLRHERGRLSAPFTTRSEFAIAGPDCIAEHIPLTELKGVFRAAERAMAHELSSVALTHDAWSPSSGTGGADGSMDRASNDSAQAFAEEPTPRESGEMRRWRAA